MIFGKTYELQRHEFVTRTIARQFGHWTFAWFPVRLKTGEKAWLRRVYVNYPWFQTSANYRLEEPSEQEKLRDVDKDLLREVQRYENA